MFCCFFYFFNVMIDRMLHKNERKELRLNNIYRNIALFQCPLQKLGEKHTVVNALLRLGEGSKD